MKYVWAPGLDRTRRNVNGEDADDDDDDDDNGWLSWSWS